LPVAANFAHLGADLEDDEEDKMANFRRPNTRANPEKGLSPSTSENEEDLFPAERFEPERKDSIANFTQ